MASARRSYGDLPARGERFRVQVSGLDAERRARPGLRGSVEVSREILDELARARAEALRWSGMT